MHGSSHTHDKIECRSAAVKSELHDLPKNMYIVRDVVAPSEGLGVEQVANASHIGFEDFEEVKIGIIHFDRATGWESF
jgi:hypothetical protein